MSDPGSIKAKQIEDLPTSAANAVSADAVIGDEKIVVGDGGARKVKDSGVTLDELTEGLDLAELAQQTTSHIIVEQIVANTGTETTIYTVTIPANSLVLGDMFRINFFGSYDTKSGGGSKAFVLKQKIDGIAVNDFDSSNKSAIDEGFWSFEWVLTVRSIGASGTIMESATVNEDGAIFPFPPLAAGIVTVDMTQAFDLTVTITWGLADPDNRFLVQQGFTEVFKNG